MKEPSTVVCLALVAAACGGPPAIGAAPPPVRPASPHAASSPERLEPTPIAGTRAALAAGLCGFEPYLSEPCGADRPTHAVLLGPFPNVDAARQARDEARRLELSTGYPFVTTASQLRLVPAEDLVVVLGLFARPDDAAALARRTSATSRRIAPRYEPSDDQAPVAIELLVQTPAWDPAALETLESELDERLAHKWVPLAEQEKRREHALARLRPTCRVPAGALFVSRRAAFHRFRHFYAPVMCENGSEAWVPWRSTRLESVVHDGPKGIAVIDQVIVVECDTPTIERRVFRTNALDRIGLGSCNDD